MARNSNAKIGSFLNAMLNPFTIELEYINRIREGLEYARERHNVPISRLNGDGTIYYMNGNDGTAFDWEMNDRLCEFGYLIRGAFAFKMLIYKDGTADIYCYPNAEEKSVEQLESKIFEPYEVEIFYESLCKNADDKKLWDVDVMEIYKIC